LSFNIYFVAYKPWSKPFLAEETEVGDSGLLQPSNVREEKVLADSTTY